MTTYGNSPSWQRHRQMRLDAFRIEDISRTIEEALPITTFAAERVLRLEIAGVDASLELSIGQEFTLNRPGIRGG